MCGDNLNPPGGARIMPASLRILLISSILVSCGADRIITLLVKLELCGDTNGTSISISFWERNQFHIYIYIDI